MSAEALIVEDDDEARGFSGSKMKGRFGGGGEEEEKEEDGAPSEGIGMESASGVGTVAVV